MLHGCLDLQASRRSDRAPLPREAVEDAFDGVGAVEDVEVNPGDAGGEKAFDLAAAVGDPQFDLPRRSTRTIV